MKVQFLYCNTKDDIIIDAIDMISDIYGDIMIELIYYNSKQ